MNEHPNAVIESNVEKFQRAAKSGLVLVYFSTSTNDLCKRQIPVLDSLSQKAGEKIPLFRFDVDEASILAEQLDVKGAPQLLVLNDGKEISRFMGVGVASESDILNVIAHPENVPERFTKEGFDKLRRKIRIGVWIFGVLLLSLLAYGVYRSPLVGLGLAVVPVAVFLAARFDAKASGAGAFAGAVAGLATHYISGDKLGVPAFVVALLLLAGVKGSAKIIALIVFGVVAGVVVVVFKH